MANLKKLWKDKYATIATTKARERLDFPSSNVWMRVMDHQTEGKETNIQLPYAELEKGATNPMDGQGTNKYGTYPCQETEAVIF